jgi:hypothetical protein
VPIARAELAVFASKGCLLAEGLLMAVVAADTGLRVKYTTGEAAATAVGAGGWRSAAGLAARGCSRNSCIHAGLQHTRHPRCECIEHIS